VATGLPVAAGELVDLSYLNAVARGYWHKTTAQVVNTTAEADLLNGEFTVPAGVLGSSRVLRLTMAGDATYGANQNIPRFRFKMGAGPTTIIDTGATAGVITSGAGRFDWEMVIHVMATGATNSQWVTMLGRATVGAITTTNAGTAFGTGSGVSTLLNLAADYKGGTAGAQDMTAVQAVLFTVVTASNTNTDVTLKAAMMEVI
jgi:hypothetical protein